MKFLKPLLLLLWVSCMAAKSFAGDLPSVEDFLKYTNEYRARKGKPKSILEQDVSNLHKNTPIVWPVAKYRWGTMDLANA